MALYIASFGMIIFAVACFVAAANKRARSYIAKNHLGYDLAVTEDDKEMNESLTLGYLIMAGLIAIGLGVVFLTLVLSD